MMYKHLFDQTRL